MLFLFYIGDYDFRCLLSNSTFSDRFMKWTSSTGNFPRKRRGIMKNYESSVKHHIYVQNQHIYLETCE